MSLMYCCLTRLIEGKVRKKPAVPRYSMSVGYASKIGLKNGSLVRYGQKCKVRSKQILNILYSTFILGHECLFLRFLSLRLND